MSLGIHPIEIKDRTIALLIELLRTTNSTENRISPDRFKEEGFVIFEDEIKEPKVVDIVKSRDSTKIFVKAGGK